MKSIGEKIKNLRIKDNLTQEQFAEKIFVSREAVSRWEQGRGLPDIDNLKNISKTFNVSLDSLLSNEDLSQVTISNNNALLKIKKTQMISLLCIAISLIFIIVFSLINFLPETSKPIPSSDMNMPEGVLIGFYIDTKGDGGINIKSVIDDNSISNDVYFLTKPNTNTYMHQGIHNLIDVNYRDYYNYQCDVFLSKDIIETSKYFSVYYNYRYEDYLKPHGYTLVEIETDPTFYFGQQFSSSFLHLYGYKYLIYGSETLSDRIINSSFYFNVFAVENFNKMKVTELDSEYNELSTVEVKNGDIYTLKPETYALKLYYTANDSTWYVSNYGTFMFGSSEPRTIDVVTQLINADGYVDENPKNNFKIIR